MKLYILDFPRRQCLIHGDYTEEEAVKLAMDQCPLRSPAYGLKPTAVRVYTDSPVLVWRNTD